MLSLEPTFDPGKFGRYRQYGLWERYAELYPDEDLVYTIGISDYKKDWFFAQVNRYFFLPICLLFLFIASNCTHLDNLFQGYS